LSRNARVSSVGCPRSGGLRSKRVAKLMEEMGVAVSPPDIYFPPPPAKVSAFIEHVKRLALMFQTIDTDRLDEWTIAFILLCYRAPPPLAFIMAELEDGVGTVELRLGDRKVIMEYHELSRILGPSIAEERDDLTTRKELTGPYIPISRDFLVTPFEVKDKEPLFKVYKNGKLSFAIYSTASSPIPPIPFNVALLLNPQAELHP